LYTYSLHHGTRVLRLIPPGQQRHATAGIAPLIAHALVPVSWGTVHDAGCQPECLVSRKTGWRGASAANAAPGLEGVTSKYGPTTSLSCRR
jgi:hypothetical protein